MIRPFRQYAKVRVVDEVTGREVIGYLTDDLEAFEDRTYVLVSEAGTGVIRRFRVGSPDWRIEDL